MTGRYVLLEAFQIVLRAAAAVELDSSSTFSPDGSDANDGKKCSYHERHARLQQQREQTSF